MSTITTTRPPLSSSLTSALKSLSVPLSDQDSCNGCAALDPDHEEEEGLDYGKGFEIDLESQMLGTVKEYGRQILISTSKSDWIREITDNKTSLAALIKETYQQKLEAGLLSGGNLAGLNLNADSPSKGEGVYDSSIQVSRKNTATTTSAKSPLLPIQIQNASFHPSHPHPSSETEAEEIEHRHQQTIILLPEYIIIPNISATDRGVKEFVDQYLGNGEGSGGVGGLRSWPLPHLAIVLICSHKARDKKCHIAAPLLISQFHRHLESHDIEIDERGDSDEVVEAAPIESYAGSPETQHRELEERLRGVKKAGETGGMVGVFKVSHVGGHRYAGNVIIYLPNGSCVWYGRVTPRDVESIVEETILKGKVLGHLLRGGLGLEGKGGAGGMLNW